jgi:hypothetical protein
VADPSGGLACMHTIMVRFATKVCFLHALSLRAQVEHALWPIVQPDFSGSCGCHGAYVPFRRNAGTYMYVRSTPLGALRPG